MRGGKEYLGIKVLLDNQGENIIHEIHDIVSLILQNPLFNLFTKYNIPNIY
jgi:hypothetical protein